MHKLFLAGILAVWAVMAWADLPIEVIDLKYKSPQEVIPLLQPFVVPGGVVTGMKNQLIIKTTPENLHELRRVLGEIDVIPQQLLISVRQGRVTDFQDEGRRYGIHISNQRGNKSHLFVGQKQFIAGDQDNHIQQIKVLEGQKAFIQTGTAIPVSTESGSHAGGTQTTYQNVTTGFYVAPRLTGNGNTVELQIAPFNNRLADEEGSIQVSEADTTVSAKVGEWIELAGVNSDSQQRSDGRNHDKEERQRVWIKVEVR
jgi:type II secretory pathway component GspD/PulD (secretin)